MANIPTIEIIAAVSKNLVIGKDNQIPWNIPKDLLHFKELTKGHVVIMGKNTYRSIPKHHFPLKDRINIIVTNSATEKSSDANVHFTTFDDLDDMMQDIKNECPGKTCFIIGGAMLYSAFIGKATKLHLTYIDKSYEWGSSDKIVRFPSFLEYKITSYSNKMYSEDEKCNFQFITYDRVDGIVENCSSDLRYLKLVHSILLSGSFRDDRTGTGTISLFAKQLRFNIDNSVPLLTTKLVPWKSCIKELLWFMKGQTNSNILKEQGVNIWNGNTTREFLDKRGLGHYPEGDIGAGYGFQWRHFGAEYKTCNDDYTGKGFDQLMFVISELKTNPFSRRIYLSSWNPTHMHKMALPPCHVSAQFYVDQDDEGKLHLSCHMYQRSVDTFLGLPFNIFSYTTLTYILAMICNMKPKELIISTGDTHIYIDHLEQMKEQVARSPFLSPKLIVNERIKNIPIEEITIDDFDIIGYFHHNTLKGKMSV